MQRPIDFEREQNNLSRLRNKFAYSSETLAVWSSAFKPAPKPYFLLCAREIPKFGEI